MSKSTLHDLCLFPNHKERPVSEREGPPVLHWETAPGGEEPLPLALPASLSKEGPMLLSGTDTCYHFPGRNSTLSAAPGWDS